MWFNEPLHWNRRKKFVSHDSVWTNKRQTFPIHHARRTWYCFIQRDTVERGTSTKTSFVVIHNLTFWYRQIIFTLFLLKLKVDSKRIGKLESQTRTKKNFHFDSGKYLFLFNVYIILKYVVIFIYRFMNIDVVCIVRQWWYLCTTLISRILNQIFSQN